MQISMLYICIDTAWQLRQRQRSYRAAKGPLGICINADNDVGNDDIALHLHWRRCIC